MGLRPVTSAAQRGAYLGSSQSRRRRLRLMERLRVVHESVRLNNRLNAPGICPYFRRFFRPRIALRGGRDALEAFISYSRTTVARPAGRDVMHASSAACPRGRSRLSPRVPALAGDPVAMTEGKPRLRSEQDIFDELAALCASPGYAHATAFFCFRDNIVGYKDELKGEDYARLFSH